MSKEEIQILRLGSNRISRRVVKRLSAGELIVRTKQIKLINYVKSSKKNCEMLYVCSDCVVCFSGKCTEQKG